jgi:magnesium-transporting ATPase (P-type)
MSTAILACFRLEENTLEEYLQNLNTS